MLDALIALAVRQRGAVLLLALALFVWGTWVLRGTVVDVFPDLNRPTVTVLVEAGGMSPDDVEQRITRPVELALQGAPGVQRVRSQSGLGLSVIWAEFGWAHGFNLARQSVAERLSSLRAELPEGAHAEMAPQSSIMGEILLVGLSADGGTADGPALRRLAEWTLRPRLLAVPGVSQVVVIGGGLERVDVQVDPAALAAVPLSMQELAERLEDATAAEGGGFLTDGEEERSVRHLALPDDERSLALLPIAEHGGEPILLARVAEVKRAAVPQRGDAGVNGQPAVVLSVQKQPGTDTRALTEAIDLALADIAPALGDGAETTVLFRQADFIDAALHNVLEALRDGVLLVTIVLLAFLLNLRTTAITLTAIPLSFVVGGLVLHAMGQTVNTMTLGGLAIAIGELVDDAIVDVENVLRRLRGARLAGDPRPLALVVIDASREVRGSIVFSTALVVLVFVPLFAMGGVEGRLFVPLGLAYVVSILASLLVSLTVTPALCATLLAHADVAEGGHDSPTVRVLKAAQRRVLEPLLPHGAPLLFGTMLVAAGAAALVPTLGTSFLPPFSEGTATIGLITTPGTSLEESNRLGQLAERTLLAIPEVKSTGRRTGRAEADEHAEGVNSTEIDVDFLEGGRPRPEVLAEVRARLHQLPGVTVNVGQPISHRLDHLLSGVRAALAVKVFGEDLHAIRAAAESLAERMQSIDGVVDVQVEPSVLVGELHSRVRWTAAAALGVPPGWVAKELATATEGRDVGEWMAGGRSVPIHLRWAPSWRDDHERRSAVPITTPSGEVVPASALVDWVETSGPNQILHEGGRRRVAVLANVAGRDLGHTAADVLAAARSIDLPDGSWVHLGGQYESRARSSQTMSVLSTFSLLLCWAVLWLHFRSHSLVVQVLLNLPLALIGSVAAVVLAEQPLSVATLVGFVTLCGIASRNTILLLTHYIHLVRHEGEGWGLPLVIRGTQERLVPVVMTALCAGLGLLPLALAQDAPGKEILTPVAQVILGGLLSSTLLDLVVTPAVFYRFGRTGIIQHLRHLGDAAALERLGSTNSDPRPSSGASDV